MASIYESLNTESLNERAPHFEGEKIYRLFQWNQLVVFYL